MMRSLHPRMSVVQSRTPPGQAASVLSARRTFHDPVPCAAAERPELVIVRLHDRRDVERWLAALG